MDALDKFVFAKEAHPAFDLALRMENYAGSAGTKLTRGSSSSGVVSLPIHFNSSLAVVLTVVVDRWRTVF